MKKIGIYKITNPKGKVYIGQSENIDFRFLTYKRLKCRAQVKLYHSFKKHGVTNHVFEIIEECDSSLLNDRERYWQEHYDVLDRNKGLNLVLVSCQNKKMVMSQTVKDKIGLAHKGKIIPNDVKLKMARRGEHNGMHGVRRFGEDNPMYGRVHNEETKQKIGIRSKERTGSKNGFSKMVLNIETGIYYDSCSEACSAYGNANKSIFTAWLNGTARNRSQYRYVSKDGNYILEKDMSHIKPRKKYNRK